MLPKWARSPFRPLLKLFVVSFLAGNVAFVLKAILNPVGVQILISNSIIRSSHSPISDHHFALQKVTLLRQKL